MESKSIRDSDQKRNGVSMLTRVAGYAIVCGADTGMLFYVFLFALQQTKVRQDAWFRSFMTWLGMDIILVCSMLVLISQIVIPSFVRKDLAKIKQKLVSTIDNYHRKVNTDCKEEINVEFNSADYLFVSTRLAKIVEFKHLAVAKIIANFRTPWPRQSYLYMKDYSHNYRSKFTMIFSSFGSVIVYLLGGFIQLPTAAQDAAVYSAFSTGFGYSLVLLAKLYYVYPALIVVPVVVGIVLVHFLIRTLSLAKPRKDSSKKVVPVEREMEVETATDRNIRNNRRKSLIEGVNLMRSMQKAVVNINIDTEEAHSCHVDSSYNCSKSRGNSSDRKISCLKISDEGSSFNSNDSDFRRILGIIMEKEDNVAAVADGFEATSSDLDFDVDLSEAETSMSNEEGDMQLYTSSGESSLFDWFEKIVTGGDEQVDSTDDQKEETNSSSNCLELASESEEGEENDFDNFMKCIDICVDTQIGKCTNSGMSLTEINMSTEEAYWANKDDSIGIECSLDISN